MCSGADSLGTAWDAAFAFSALELLPTSCLTKHELRIFQLVSAAVPWLQQLWAK